jgi:NADPH:quinone reductase-like Zn-dependent oxidoreductase
MLLSVAGLAPGETVLVLAAGSGVGQAAVQIAKLAGARVLATAGSPAKLDRARTLGAEAVIDHRQQDVAREVKNLTHGRGVDIVVEHVGEATWEASVRSLARGGRLVTCGATSGPRVAIDLRVLFARQISLRGSYMGSKRELLQVAALFFDGRLRPAVDEVFPLERAADAQRRLEAGLHFGKIVVEIP